MARPKSPATLSAEHEKRALDRWRIAGNSSSAQQAVMFIAEAQLHATLAVLYELRTKAGATRTPAISSVDRD